MEDDDLDFFEAAEESIFEIDAQIQDERTVDPSKMAANRKAIIHNQIMGWARADIATTPTFC